MRFNKNLLIIVIFGLFIALPAYADTTDSSGTCSCYGTVTAGALLPNSTFNNYCSQAKQYCSCGDGTATCQGSFSSTKVDCEKLNTDTESVLTDKYGVPSIALSLVNYSGACSFQASSAQKSSSQSKSSSGLIPSCATGTDVPPLSCILTLLGNISKWILGISGSIALLMFVYGGFMMLASGGQSGMIQKGKTILTQAIIGLIIIFGAYFAIDFLTKALGFQESKFAIPAESAKTKPTAKPTAPTTSTNGCCLYGVGGTMSCKDVTKATCDGASGTWAAGTKCNSTTNLCQ